MALTELQTLRMLLEAGADPTLRNRQGQTASQWFRAEGLKQQADLVDAATKARSEPAGAAPLASAPATN
jgi:ankyrin repeat protein